MRNRILHHFTTFYKSILQAFCKHVTRLNVPAGVCVCLMCVETPNFRLKPLLAQRVGGIYMWGLESALEAHGCQVAATLSAMQKKGKVFHPRDSDHLYFHRCMCQIFTASDRCRVARSLPPQTVTVLPDRYHPRPLLVRYNTYGGVGGINERWHKHIYTYI